MKKVLTIAALSTAIMLGSIGNAEAGRRGNGAAIGLGIMGAIIGGAIIADQYRRHDHRRRYHCHYKRERYWSRRYQGWYWRTVERCHKHR